MAKRWPIRIDRSIDDDDDEITFFLAGEKFLSISKRSIRLFFSLE